MIWCKIPRKNDPVAQLDRAPAFVIGAFTGKWTCEVDVANSVNPLVVKGNTELPEKSGKCRDFTRQGWEA